AAPLEPLLGREFRLRSLRPRLGERGPNRRGRALGLRVRALAEVEEDLTRFGLPALRAVLDDDLAALHADPHRGQRVPLGHPLTQPRERAPDATRRQARVSIHQAARGPQEDEVLEGEPELAALAPLRGEDPGADVSAELSRGHPEQATDLF